MWRKRNEGVLKHMREGGMVDSSVIKLNKEDKRKSPLWTKSVSFKGTNQIKQAKLSI